MSNLISRTILGLLCGALIFTGALFVHGHSPAIQTQSAISGEWIVDPTPKADTVQLTLRRSEGYEHNFSSSHGIPVSSLAGLSSAQMNSSGTNVRFEIGRDAGVFLCEGWFANGKGAGHFAFQSNPRFVSEMNSLGYNNLSEERLFSLAVFDISIAFIQ